MAGSKKVYTVVVYKEKPYTRVIEVLHIAARSAQEVVKVHLPTVRKREKGEKLLILTPSQVQSLKDKL